MTSFFVDHGKDEVQVYIGSLKNMLIMRVSGKHNIFLDKFIEMTVNVKNLNITKRKWQDIVIKRMTSFLV